MKDISRKIFFEYKYWFDRYPYRRAYNKNNLIFIHIPKAAGTSILNAIGHAGTRDHCTYREFEKAHPIKFKRYFKFTVVRNPYERFVSLYSYLSKGGNGKSDLDIANLIKTENLDINSFSHYMLEHNLHRFHPMFLPQVYYICDHNLNVKMDFVAHVENLAADFKFIKSKLRKISSLEHVNSSSLHSKSVDLTMESLEIIQEVYDYDFKVLGYSQDRGVISPENY